MSVHYSENDRSLWDGAAGELDQLELGDAHHDTLVVEMWDFQWRYSPCDRRESTSLHNRMVLKRLLFPLAEMFAPFSPSALH